MMGGKPLLSKSSLNCFEGFLMNNPNKVFNPRRSTKVEQPFELFCSWKSITF